jgi:hypothetical protein
MLIELTDPTDPRYLLVDELPERVTMGDLASWRFGKPLLFPVIDDSPVRYAQPDGPGTAWVRP